MAHIAVHLQRTPQGLHPASAVALCWARDIGSARGATVTGLCIGDAGHADKGIAAAAARFGADVLLFSGRNGLRNLCERLNPVHVLVPFTPMGLATAAEVELGPATPRWVDRRSPPYATADAVTAVVAGVKPWHRFNGDLDPEFEGDVDEAPLPAFVCKAEAETEAELSGAPVFELGAVPLGYVAPPGLDPVVATALAGLNAAPTSLADGPHLHGGTTIILSSVGSTLALEPRSDLGRVIVLPGAPSTDASPTDVVPSTWRHVDWVMPGRWTDVIASLREGPWSQAPA